VLVLVLRAGEGGSGFIYLKFCPIFVEKPIFVIDYVYFETSSTSPYQIRRIEELNKTASGNVEAKVMCFYRRRDLPGQLIQLADKHQCKWNEPFVRDILSSFVFDWYFGDQHFSLFTHSK
jgi:hypothetical protein